MIQQLVKRIFDSAARCRGYLRARGNARAAAARPDRRPARPGAAHGAGLGLRLPTAAPAESGARKPVEPGRSIQQHRPARPRSARRSRLGPLGYSYVLENTRAVQILRRVVREYRSGEGLGIPGRDAAVAGCHRGAAVRRGQPVVAVAVDQRRPPESRSRTPQRLLAPVRPGPGVRHRRQPAAASTTRRAPPTPASSGCSKNCCTSCGRRCRTSQHRRRATRPTTTASSASPRSCSTCCARGGRTGLLAREELAAATVLGLGRADAQHQHARRPGPEGATPPSAANRLQLIGERVGLPAHSKSAALFSMARNSRFSSAPSSRR